tara:strand:- start:41 stop:322 length:282 start_codon:yes stop_codon:yes gene_type:complete
MMQHVSTKIKEEDNKVFISRSQDVQAILDYNKEKQINGYNKNSEFRHVCGIPFVEVEKWLHESGLQLGSKEFAEYIKKKIISGDYSKLMVHGY